MRLVFFLIIYGISFLYSQENHSSLSVEIRFLTQEEIKADFTLPSQIAKFDPDFPKNLFYFYGFPEKKIKYFTKRPVFSSKYKQEQDFIIKNDILKGYNKIFSQVISAKGFAPGERVYVLYEARKPAFKHEISFIPYPIIAKDEKTGISIEAELKMVCPAFYDLKFNGFTEGEKLKLQSFSSGEVIESTLSTKNGFMYSPDVKGKRGGEAKLIFIRNSGEKITIFLPWGEELLGYLEGKKIYKTN